MIHFKTHISMKNKLYLIIGALVLAVIPACQQQIKKDETPSIRIFEQNPFYWEYKGKPVLLIGGSKQDNLFNHPEELKEHLDLLQSSGGNYVRNTMSSRNPGNPWGFKKLENGLYDLNQWNDEYWERFANLISMADERDIIVQIEIWDPWDYYKSEAAIGFGAGNVGWESNPFNPMLNINYTAEETGLFTEIDTYPAGSPSTHLFFHTVPQLQDIPLVRQYQEKFVEKILSITLNHPNVLYCMNNETGEHPQWGQYWAGFIRQKASDKGKEVFLADMRYNTNLQTEDHRQLLHDRENFDFFEISQNNNNVNDQLHYDRFQEIRSQIVDNPKPLNNIKIYGGEPQWTTSAEEGTRRFWRNIFGGAASVRFHREGPSRHFFGIGLSELAQTHIKSARMLTDAFHIFTCQPSNHLLGNRDDNEAYCTAEEGKQYAVYFTDGGEVTLDLLDVNGKWEMKWMNVLKSEWEQTTILDGNAIIDLKTPGPGKWAVLILPSDTEE
jgi:hypothetical protein